MSMRKPAQDDFLSSWFTYAEEADVHSVRTNERERQDRENVERLI